MNNCFCPFFKNNVLTTLSVSIFMAIQRVISPVRLELSSLYFINIKLVLVLFNKGHKQTQKDKSTIVCL